MLSYASFLPRSLTNHLTLTLTNHLMLCIRLFSTDLTLHSHNTVDVRRTLGPKKKKKRYRDILTFIQQYSSACQNLWITHNATQILTVQFMIWLCYATSG